jgi:hypothetical protein
LAAIAGGNQDQERHRRAGTETDVASSFGR